MVTLVSLESQFYSDKRQTEVGTRSPAIKTGNLIFLDLVIPKSGFLTCQMKGHDVNEDGSPEDYQI